MIPLSPRLLTCAAMVKGNHVLDIGTDHAFLPVYLVMSGKCDRAIATDVKQGPLNAAAATLQRYKLTKQITMLLTDGFRKVNPNGVTDVVIAGMGGENIRAILSDPSAKWVQNGINLVLQPMTKPEVLRTWLAENGFTVTMESAVRDIRIYTVMQAVYTGEKHSLSPAEAYYGKLKRTELLTKIYIANVQERLHTKEQGLLQANQTEEAQALREIINGINLWLKPEEGGQP